jgi:hypothetical protein
MSRRASFYLLPLACSLIFGCRSSSDLVEAELRTRENDVRELRDELYRAECQNDALQREIRAVRQSGSSKISPEQAAQSYTLKQITLGRGTGGYDDDLCPGDEALQVVVEPRDGDGHVIKAPGALHIDALDISPEGIKTPMSSWDLTPDQVRRGWKSGLLSSGYTFVLPWKNWPTSERVRVVARFILSDGRVFEADKDVPIRLTPAAQRKPPAVDLDGPAMAIPDPADPTRLPMPRKLDQPKPGSSQSWWRGPSDKKESEKPPAWWRTPASQRAPAPPADQWRPRAQPSLTDSVQFLPPTPLPSPGEAPNR